ncbi:MULTISPECIES: type II toxin-antitoxin system Phd/YefM family antitoxin [unclassified Rhizobium]|jgi:prevent-host-death family protein|uniref:type II toxin-antitoxin system Phd/YefM family antitoxin n=1 Tax=unclassified Rhizobium TaxID=2613769 RepID=UPI000DD5D54F|nr:type II toxin-antitoxin system prevent-host-death family antitoxin [Rhizobium sp. UBA1881]
MRISVKEAEGQLTELVRLANQGEEIVLTQDGQPAARIEAATTFIDDPVKREQFIQRLRNDATRPPLSREEKSRLISRLREEIRQKNLPPGPDAAHSQDFLYDEDGLPK